MITAIHTLVYSDDPTATRAKHHAIAVMCDDLDVTITELSGRGAEFLGDPQDMGFGRGALMRVPGADDMFLYQPRHATAYDLD